MPVIEGSSEQLNSPDAQSLAVEQVVPNLRLEDLSLRYDAVCYLGQLEVRDAAAVAALIVVADDDENCTVVGSIHRDVMFHRRLVSLAISGQ